MSFGGVIVDQHGFTDRFPGTAMLTGLIANALGWEHADADKLHSLQRRLQFAARWDVRPEVMVDYQTVDLGQPKMLGHADRARRGSVIGGWTTRGQPEHRAGGPAAKYGIHQRYRHYLTDGLLTVALSLQGDGTPTLETVKEAFQRPARPLFIGRKTCLPARPLLDPKTPVLEGPDVLSILRRVSVWDRAGRPAENVKKLLACWPAELASSLRADIRRVYDLRDWQNQIPAGSRMRAEGFIEVSS